MKSGKVYPSVPNKRILLAPKIFGELDSAESLQDSEKRVCIQVFYRNLVIITAQLNIRFKALEEISQTFKCLSPQILLASSDQDFIANAKELAEA